MEEKTMAKKIDRKPRKVPSACQMAKLRQIEMDLRAVRGRLDSLYTDLEIDFDGSFGLDTVGEACGSIEHAIDDLEQLDVRDF